MTSGTGAAPGDWRKARDAAERRLRARSNPIPSFYENWAMRQDDTAGDEALAQLARHAAWSAEGRFVPWEVRRAVPLDGLDARRWSEIPAAVLRMSQGISGVLQWRGRDLFKNVFDFALLPMLIAELRPATILEIGSGNGASAVWLSDMAAIGELACRIVSVDVAPAALDHPGVQFLEADARDLGAGLPPGWAAQGPRLVLEDAHVGVAEVLDYVDSHLTPGDYLVIEDSVGKAAAIEAFLAARAGRYAVDTRYTDFFGRNATSCVDSILKRLR
jgi:cephalosporin hydroxylase